MSDALKQTFAAQLLGRSQALSRQLADLGGCLLLSLGEAPAIPVTVPTAVMSAVPGVENVWWLQLPCAYPEAPTCTRLLVGGLMSAQSDRVRVPHDVRLHLLEGALLWWQQSFGYDEQQQPAYRRYAAGDVWQLVKDEAHTYVALSDFLMYNTFSPFFPV